MVTLSAITNIHAKLYSIICKKFTKVGPLTQCIEFGEVEYTASASVNILPNCEFEIIIPSKHIECPFGMKVTGTAIIENIGSSAHGYLAKRNDRPYAFNMSMFLTCPGAGKPKKMKIEGTQIIPCNCVFVISYILHLVHKGSS